MGGSSPPVRGTGGLVLHGQDVHRFIPARAGNSAKARAIETNSPVHPRPCGEQCPPDAPRFYDVGSSPPVRGTGAGLQRVCCGARFIPARAGNSDIEPAGAGELPVHPRPCGEQGTVAAGVVTKVGSSPPVRGTDMG